MDCTNEIFDEADILIEGSVSFEEADFESYREKYGDYFYENDDIWEMVSFVTKSNFYC